MNIIEQNITADEYMQLRADAGWGIPTEPDSCSAIESSLIVLVMRTDGNLVGTVRVVGDGRLCFYIQDLIVLKHYQKKGYGRALLEAALDFVHTHAAPNAFIGLMAAKGVESMYEKYGFITRPNDHMGPGMVKFFGRPGAVTEV